MLDIPQNNFWNADIAFEGMLSLYFRHTILHLLPLCRTARGGKFQRLVETVHKAGLEFVQIDDVATGDFTDALKGVDVVLHMACPLAGKKGLDETFQVCVLLSDPFSSSANSTLYFQTAIDGTINVVRQAQKAGVKKIVATSSFGAVISRMSRTFFICSSCLTKYSFLSIL